MNNKPSTAHRENPVQQPVEYQSFLVRLWKDEASDCWHAFAKHARTGRVHQFSDVGGLLLFLNAATESAPYTSDGHPS